MRTFACCADVIYGACASTSTCVRGFHGEAQRPSSPAREGGEKKKKRKEAKKEREREGAREASFHRETKIAVINGPELWTRGAFF